MKQPEVKALQPEVATRYALGPEGRTRFYVTQLGREVDLCQLTLAEADELVQLPGGADMLQPVAPVASENSAPAEIAPAATTGHKRKSGAPGGK